MRVILNALTEIRTKVPHHIIMSRYLILDIIINFGIRI